jgi:hypothetical protein
MTMAGLAKDTLKLLPRALAIILVVSAPVLALPALQNGQDSIIEAPTAKKTGAGFVLVVSLRRGS